MDTQTLERLLIDRALGQLPPDTRELLDAWLAEHPSAKALNQAVEETVTAARSALAESPPSMVPPFPAKAIGRAGRLAPGWRMAGKAASLAACVLIGVGLHAAWKAESSQDAAPPEAVRIVRNVQPIPFAQAAAEPESPGFWSAKRLEEQARQRRPERGKRVIWDSPLSTPRLGDTT